MLMPAATALADSLFPADGSSALNRLPAHVPVPIPVVLVALDTRSNVHAPVGVDWWWSEARPFLSAGRPGAFFIPFIFLPCLSPITFPPMISTGRHRLSPSTTAPSTSIHPFTASPLHLRKPIVESLRLSLCRSSGSANF